MAFIFGDVEDHIRIGIALLLAILFGITAFLLSWLTYDGSLSAGLFGTIAYGIGHWQIAVIVLFFFISASLVSKDIAATEDNFSVKFRRDGRQVWSNGFWLCLWILIWFITDAQIFITAAVASIATATADTWATELGNKGKSKTYLVTNFNKVSAGTDGGISLRGSLAALTGATLIAGIFWISYIEISITIFLMITIAGFLGCFIDSYLGAKLQGSSIKIPFLSNNESGNITVSNNIVNWLSTGSASILVLLITLII